MRDDRFAFFRGTFYRWAQLWPSLSPEERDAPRLLAVGDCHVDSFRTWRDAEGRLAWGVETANVHIGTRSAISAVLVDLRHRSARWLQSAATTMAKAMEQEWKAYRSRTAER